MHESPTNATTFGYLTAVASAEHGYFGGYLVVSHLGRPMEFHCTVPILPSRAQQILYGPTLEPFLLGEQIGGSLLAAAKLAPRLILTDWAQFELVQQRIDAPVVLVTAVDSGGNNAAASTADGVHGSAASAAVGWPADVKSPKACSAWGPPFSVGTHNWQLPVGIQSQRAAVVGLLERLCERVDLVEPFARIHEAIREAQRISARGQEAYAPAA
jgi:hypothetical protein